MSTKQELIDSIEATEEQLSKMKQDLDNFNPNFAVGAVVQYTNKDRSWQRERGALGIIIIAHNNKVLLYNPTWNCYASPNSWQRESGYNECHIWTECDNIREIT